MDIAGKDVLVLGGHGLVGGAVCRELLAHGPARLVIASRRRAHAEAAVAQLREEAGNAQTLLLPAWGDVFLRADGQESDGLARSTVVAYNERRRAFVADLLEPLDEDIVDSSMLASLILGTAPALDGRPAEFVIDCINMLPPSATRTSTAAAGTSHASRRPMSPALIGLRRSGACWPCLPFHS